MHVAALHGRLPAGVSMFAPSQETLLNLHDKYAFIKHAQSYGLRVPATFAAASAEASELARSGGHVIKPVFSCSGKGVRDPKFLNSSYCIRSCCKPRAMS